MSAAEYRQIEKIMDTHNGSQRRLTGSCESTGGMHLEDYHPTRENERTSWEMDTDDGQIRMLSVGHDWRRVVVSGDPCKEKTLRGSCYR